MHLTNTITLPGAPDEVFDMLLDVERLAGCLPGTTLTGRNGDAHTGKVKLKVGPLSVRYGGELRFLEVDRDGRRLVMKAGGKEVDGNGNVDAKVTAQVTGAGGDSTVLIDTDLVIRGRVAQFGRGAMTEVSQRLMDEFATNVADLLRSGGADSATTDGAPGHEPAQSEATLNAAKLLLPTLARRAIIPATVAIAAGIWALVRRRSRAARQAR